MFPSLLGVRISESHDFTLCIKWVKATNYKIDILIILVTSIKSEVSVSFE